MPEEKKAPAAPKLPEATEKMIEDWVMEFFHNSIVAQTPQCFNRVREGVNALKLRLISHVKQ